MTTEQAIKFAEAAIGKSQIPECNEFYRLAADALRASLTPPNEPLTCDGCYWKTHGSIGKCIDCVREKTDNYYHRPTEGEEGP